MAKQSYQELAKVIANDLIGLGDERLNEAGKDFQDYFYKAKQENPDRYPRLTFDTNGVEPSSSVLEDILTDLRGILIGSKLYIKKENISLFDEK